MDFNIGSIFDKIKNPKPPWSFLPIFIAQLLNGRVYSQILSSVRNVQDVVYDGVYMYRVYP